MQEHSVELDASDALDFAEWVALNAKNKIEVSVVTGYIEDPKKPAETIIRFLPMKKTKKSKTAFVIRIRDLSWMNS